MAQVRARRPFVSIARGRVNQGSGDYVEPQPKQSVVRPPDYPIIETINLPPFDEATDQTGRELPDATDEFREAPGTGEVMQGVTAPADGTETSLSTVDYSKMTMAQLARELKDRKLPSSGTKPELVKRLEESDARQGS